MARFPAISRLIGVSDYKRQEPVGYFSLPLEIRKIIMELIFVSGDVYLEGPKPRKQHHKLSRFQRGLHRAIKTVTRQNDNRLLHYPGFQMLATCKQACDEGYAVFYSSNCFFLPTGSIEHARSALEAIQPHHRDMIKTFGLVLSQNDLTPAVFEQAYQAMRGRWGTSLKDRPRGQDFTQAEQWGILVAAELGEIWEQKYNLALTASKGLGHLKYRVARNLEERNTRNTGGLVAFVDAENDMHDWPPEIRKQVWSTARLVWAHVEGFVIDEGWKALRKKVNRGGFAWINWYD